MACILCCHCCSFAQSNGSPKPLEKQAIDKAVRTITPLIEGFGNENWQKSSGGADSPGDYSVQKKPDVPIGTAPFNDWHFTVKQGSALSDTTITPLLTALQHQPAALTDKKAMDACDSINKRLENTRDIFVEVHLNEKSLPVKSVRKDRGRLNIPGCYFAYKQPSGKLIGTDRNLQTTYVPAFGNWDNTNLRHYSNIEAYEFHFIHPSSSPYIENIVIILSGNEDCIKQLISSVRWADVHKALTL